MQNDNFYMSCALKEAQLAINSGEVPVGAVIVKNGEIIAKGHNTRETEQNPLGHAEINAIKNAAAVLNSWRLDECTLYVTLEPCPMCAGAIINSRIKRVVYGADDLKQGCFGSLCDLSAMRFQNVPIVKSNVLNTECLKILQNFFENLRNL